MNFLAHYPCDNSKPRHVLTLGWYNTEALADVPCHTWILLEPHPQAAGGAATQGTRTTDNAEKPMGEPRAKRPESPYLQAAVTLLNKGPGAKTGNYRPAQRCCLHALMRMHMHMHMPIGVQTPQ